MKKLLPFIIFLSPLIAISQNNYQGTFWRANMVDTYELAISEGPCHLFRFKQCHFERYCNYIKN